MALHDKYSTLSYPPLLIYSYFKIFDEQYIFFYILQVMYGT